MRGQKSEWDFTKAIDYYSCSAADKGQLITIIDKFSHSSNHDVKSINVKATVVIDLAMNPLNHNNTWTASMRG